MALVSGKQINLKSGTMKENHVMSQTILYIALFKVCSVQKLYSQSEQGVKW